jgi:5'/3'-nucleotidase
MTEHNGDLRPLILISNDDGIEAPGILALAACLDEIGEIVVVAPQTEQSAVGHAITLRDPVRAHPVSFRVPSGVIPAYAVTGTPADCVKLGIDKLLPRSPSIVVSGINQGPNTAVNILYSGTVSAATEAAILGIPAVACSYCRWSGGDFNTSARIVRTVVLDVLKSGITPGVLLNVNVPDIPYDELRGIMITRQARSKWEESFTERKDPFDIPYYWLSGTFVNLDEGENTDLYAVENGYVSVTPVHHDLTAHAELEELRGRSWTI